jgi:PAS domain S-box-containing protein
MVVTSSERAEASLSADWVYRLLIDSITDYGIYMINPAGIVTSWNPGAQKLKGYTSQEIVGQHFSRFYTDEDQRAGLPLRTLEVALREGRFEAEGWRVRKNGQRFWAHIVVEPIRTSTGAPVGFAKITRDLTDRKLAETKDRQITALKGRAVSLQSQKMEAIGTLSAGVAHDFNNILQSIVGSLELVSDDLADGTTAREFVGIALGAAIRGSSLTQHLLAYARKQVLQPQRVALAPFVSDMRQLLARTLGPHISIEARVDQTPYVLVDPGQLQTALLNLAINAAHAMPRGGTLSIRAHEESEAGHDWVAIAVTDTGVGMDEATLAQAVEPFFTTKGTEGTGLGLSMVNGFAEQSGGRFAITSAPGEGTTIELRLPSSAPGEPVRPLPCAPWTSSARILLVDDSMDVLLTAGAFLKKAGFAVVPAVSGDEALSLLALGEQFDGLVTDYAMHGLSGADLVIEAQIFQPGLPAMIITGYADLSLMQKLPAGTTVLRKPFQRTDLAEALWSLVNTHENVKRNAAARSVSEPLPEARDLGGNSLGGGQNGPQVPSGDVEHRWVVGDH